MSCRSMSGWLHAHLKPLFADVINEQVSIEHEIISSAADCVSVILHQFYTYESFAFSLKISVVRCDTMSLKPILRFRDSVRSEQSSIQYVLNTFLASMSLLDRKFIKLRSKSGRELQCEIIRIRNKCENSSHLI